MADQFVIRGNNQERGTFTEVMDHYDMAKEDLNVRAKSWDTVDELFRSHIDDSSWPYNAEVFDPRVFTAIFEKTARLLARKPRGRLVPREGGDSLGAHINNELLKFQWDDNFRVDDLPMVAKWSMMDMNARKYGASFGLVKWHYERRIKGRDKDNAKSTVWYDGPNFKPLINRDCLPNPSYSTIKKWFQHRDYLTLDELKRVNDAARSKPVYKNLDLLLEAIKDEAKGTGDTRASNWASKNKNIKNLTDYLGRDEYFKTVEVVTEYRPNRWVTFAPKHGVVIRDIANPFDHNQIPVVMLKYYPIDDDLYGLSEIEPIEKLQKCVNAVLCQYLDAINQGLYNIVNVKDTGVKMHTLEWGPGKKWISKEPGKDIVPIETGNVGVSEFGTTYRFIIGAMMEALGESSAAVSNLVPGESKKTATEIQDLALQRNARDNFNQIFLTEALKKQMLFWLKMNQQLLFTEKDSIPKIIRIVGKDAIRYFKRMGVGAETVDAETVLLLNSPYFEGMNLDPESFSMPNETVDVEGETRSKFETDGLEEFGTLIIEKDDLAGTYDYIPDIESMSIPDDNQMIAARKTVVDAARDPVTLQLLAGEGYKLNLKELLEDYFERLGIKDADKYFDKVEKPDVGGIKQPTLGGGAGGPRPVPVGAGPETAPGMEGGTAPMAGVQDKQFVG